MQEAFNMSMRKSITGIHITLSGDFSSHNLDDFSACINEAELDNARIFIDVRNLKPMSDLYCNIFKQCYAHIKPKNIYFKGEQGVQLGHNGNRILFMKSHSCKCAGACQSCACQNRAKSRDEKFSFLRKQQ